jgi:hypothetical protein
MIKQGWIVYHNKPKQAIKLNLHYVKEILEFIEKENDQT